MKSVKICALLVAILFSLTACDSDEPYFDESESEKLSTNDFANKVVGQYWISDEEYEILDNGKLAYRDYVEAGVLGNADVSYYFKNMQNLIIYVYGSVFPHPYYHEDTYTYDATTGIVKTSSNGYFTVAKVEDDRLYLVNSDYSFDDREPCQVLHIYKPATDEQIDGFNTIYLPFSEVSGN